MNTAVVNALTGEVSLEERELPSFPEPEVTAAEVKAEAQRRIEASGLSWLVQREVSGGAPIPETVKSYAAAVRAASNGIEVMDPIPADFRDDSYWPEVVA